MSVLALALVLAAAAIHATWNYLLKRSGGGTLFVWWFATLSAVIYAPLAVAVIWVVRPPLGAPQAALMFASALLHTAYYLLLDRGYRSGDLSLVYPLARGSAPLITVMCAVLLLREQPSVLVLTGALLIASGAIGLTGNWRDLRARGDLHAVGFALLTGAAIASYTVVDKLAVAAFMVPPLLQDWAANLGRVALMTPVAIRRRAELRAIWQRSWREIVGIAVLCPLSYILVLSAMVFTPLSYVAPAREISILFGAMIGARLLREANPLRRLAGAAAMVTGMTCLALG